MTNKALHYANPISGQPADPADPTQLPTLGQVNSLIASVASSGGSGGTATVPLSSVWRPELDRYPAVDSVNGPMTADSGILSGDVSATTGLRFIPWDATDVTTGQPIFNYQGMVPSYAPANIQSAAGRTCLLNAFTPRWFNGATGQYYNGHQSIRVGIASTRVIPVWWTGQGQLAATKIDMHIMVEHGGRNKHLSSTGTANDGLPNVLASAGSGTYRRELTYARHEYREHRFMLGPNGYFLGCWVDSISVIRRPKNRPQNFIHGTDSWNDPQTVVNTTLGWTTGDYQSIPQCVVSSFKTGMCHGSDAQGGTGEYNANATSGGDLATYNGNRSSAAWSDSRVNWRANWWSSQYPTFTDIGGWNDGNSLVSPYQSTYRTRVQTRIQKTIDAISSLNRQTRFLNVGIQPVQITSTTDAKYLAALGQADIPGLFPGVVLGHVPLMDMWWYDTVSTTTGPRALYCNPTDRIHLVAIGDDAVCGYMWDRAADFPIDVGYMVKTETANVPIVTVPTS